MDGDFEDAFKDDETDERPRRSLNNAAMVAIPGAILKIVARRTDASKGSKIFQGFFRCPSGRERATGVSLSPSFFARLGSCIPRFP